MDATTVVRKGLLIGGEWHAATILRLAAELGRQTESLVFP